MSAPEETYGGLHAGYAAVDVTPPAGTDLTGFINREGPCTGTLDPLEVRALVFQDARGQRAALITCDLIGLGRHLVARVRERVAAAAGIPAAAQLFTCSHTHAGPETGVLTTIGLPNAVYLAALEERLAAVIERAAGALSPVRLRVAATDVPDGLVVNRVFRRVGRPGAVDHQLTVVRVDRVGQGVGSTPRGAGPAPQAPERTPDRDTSSPGGAGSPLACIVAFACHAVALGSGERQASADFVAALRRDLEAAGTGPVLYVNGCGGDVNPASMDARGRDASETLGRRLAEEALPLWRRAVPMESDAVGGIGVAAAQERVTLPLQPLRSAEEAAVLLAAGRKRLAAAVPGSPTYRGARVTEVEYPLRLLRLHYGSEALPDTQGEVQALRIGPLAVVALPGEIFSSLGRRIKAESPLAPPHTIVAGWANDNVGYIPDADAYPLGGYEVDSASRYYGYPAGWAREAGEALVAAAGRLLRQTASDG